MTAVRTFGPNRRRAAVLLLVCAVFVALGVGMRTEQPVAAWCCIVLFGLGLVLAVLRSTTRLFALELTPEGLVMVTFGRRHTTRWTDVLAFDEARLGRRRVIAVTYRPASPVGARMRAVSRAVAGMEGMVANDWDAPLDEVLAALREWHERYAGPRSA